MIIFFDTETTGLISQKLELSDPSQPRIISLAAILVDDDKNIVDQMNILVKHDGLEIPEFITKINGITSAMCDDDGVMPAKAIEQFNDMKAKSTIRVAHNVMFDKCMVAREELALGMEHLPYHGETFCTMQMCRALGMKGNLAKMYNQLFGKDFEGAHNALADTMACMEIFFKIRAA